MKRTVIVDMVDRAIVETHDFATMSEEDLDRYVALGYQEAIDEYIRRFPEATQLQSVKAQSNARQA